MKKIYLLLILCCFARATSAQTIVYNQSFTGGVTPSTQCTAWVSFCSSLLSSYQYTGFNISGSLNPSGFTCTSPTVALAMANALRTGTAASQTSDGHTWNVALGCGSGCGGAGGQIVEFYVDGSNCACSVPMSIRPAINNSNWGGLNGAGCPPPSQTLILTFFYQSLLFVTPSPGSTTVCQNSTANSINSLLATTDPAVGLTETWTVINSPVHGTLSGFPRTATTTGGTVTPTGLSYTPTAGYSGVDSFRIQASDGSATAQKTIIVTVNPLPSAITGTTSFCQGTTSTLSDPSGSGTWTSSNLAVATIGSTGITTGVSAGTDTITFTLSSTGCSTTTQITVNPLPASITGVTTLCVGATTTLSDATSGGTWTSSSGAQATIGSSSGIVFGVTASTPTITYTGPNGCRTTTVITVNAIPAAISGSTPVCPGSNITLTDATSGGSWSSSNPAQATVGSSTGIVTGVSGGNPVVSYTLPTGCLTSVIVTVNPMSPITGGTGLCVGATLALSDATPSGTWSSNNTAVATIGSSSGVVTGVSLGTTVISYSVPALGCVSTSTISVSNAPTAFTVTGGGSYCSGGSGVSVSLSGSTLGVSYQLKRGGVPTGAPIFGTGGTISFGAQTVGGTYTVTANPGTSCALDMTGSVSVVVNALPSIATATGGGSYCAGGTGVHVFLNTSQIGVNYQLYNGVMPVGSPVPGTGASIDFGLQTATGVDSVVGTNATTGCVSIMAGRPVISTTPLPTQFNVTGGGGYCVGGIGVAVTLSGSEAGVNYQLYYGGSPVTGAIVGGTGSPISFGLQTAAGTYTVVATNTTTTCTNNMLGSVTVTINSLPTVFTVTGGGPYCSGGTGVAVGTNGSTIGVNYQLFRGGLAVGAPLAGTGVALSFGLQTVAGSYTVTAINPTTGCGSNMFGSVSVSINPLPVSFTVTGGGSYCVGGTGLHVGLSGSVVGTSYQLLNGTTVVDAASGTGSPIDFGLELAAGVYTVVATNTTTGCTATMTGSVTITINPLPLVYTVTGGGSYCAGGTGVAIGLSGSNTGISYQLFNGTTAVGSPVAGTGAAISFGLQTGAGSYTVVATNNATTCTSIMSSSAAVAINPLPSLFTVTGGGGYCTGGTGVHIGLTGTNSGISYQLFRGLALVGPPIIGTGSPIDFGFQTLAGTYTVVATNTTTTCTSIMSSSAVVSINALPAVQTVTGGGAYCTGGSGVHVGLSSSVTGVNYQLFRGTTAVGAALPGTGLALDFGFQTVAGTYTVVATDLTTTCTNNMASSATVTITALPTAFTVTGGGGYCAGGTGVHVGLNSSSIGVNYQLYQGPATVGAPIAGTGTPLDFGLQTGAGVYTVVATNPSTTCTNSMLGSVTVSINPLPALFTLTGGGNYCFGTTGVHIGLNGSVTGFNYQLYLGTTAVGAPVLGTGAALDFGLQTAVGTYTIKAMNVTTGCVNNMIGSTAVNIDPLPNTHNVTGGGNYCPSGTGVHVGLDMSDVGVNYQLYNGTTAVGSPVAGTGLVIDFGLQTATGTYTVVATNTLTGCSAPMTGSAVVGIYSLPVVYNVTGGGNYCPSGVGVHIGLDGSNIGVVYQLYDSSSTVGSPVAGTGLPLDFGLQTGAGTYTVVATNVSSTCTNNMNGSAVIAINANPVVFIVTGGGSYCAGGTGVHIGLTGSEMGASYQLYNGTSISGAAVAGTGGVLDLGTRTAAGTYTVVSTYTGTSCTSNMIGSATITINPLPNTYTVTGGGSYCAGGTGVHVMLGGSNIGISYQLYRGTTAVGSPVAGTGAILDFGLQTVVGVYKVVGTNTVTGCSNNMTGSVNVIINALPNVYSVTGGGTYCAGGTGLHVMLNGSNTGISYQLYRGVTPVGSPIAGTGFGLDFGLQTAIGSYTVVATDIATGCTKNMLGTATIATGPLPNVYNVSSTSSNYCIGGIGVDIYLNSSEVGINYQLYHGTTAVGGSVLGTGASVHFGFFLDAGTYTAVATNPVSGCTRNMSSSVTVVIDPLPIAFTVTGGGNYCTGGAGVHVGLSGSNIGVQYQLYVDASPVGSPMVGTGAALDFGLFSATGMYTVVATNPLTTCVNNMSGAAAVGIAPLPAVYTVTGGGDYCAMGAGVSIGLSGSDAGITYQLYLGTTAVGSPVTGTGGALDFGMVTGVGTYNVVATNPASGCTNNMFGMVDVGISAAPTGYTVTGGGNYCPGGVGVHIGLSNSNTGISYQLYNGTTAVGAPVFGTGSGIDFGLQTTAGTYTVVGTNITTMCTGNMSGSVNVVINALPTLFAVTGGGSYCAGSGGVMVGLNGSTVGVNYQLYNGIGAVGSPVAGSGGILDLGMQTAAGTYTVIATNATTTCSRNMAGSASVTVNPVLVPVVNISTPGGDTLCSGVFTTFTATPINGGLAPGYQWKVNSVPSGTSSSYGYIPTDGDVLSVTMTSHATCASPATVTKTMTLHVIAQGTPEVTALANPGNEVCAGTAVEYSASPVFGGGAPSYTWVKNGVNVGATGTFTYTPQDGDIVYVVMNSSYRCRTSNVAASNHITMTVDQPTTPSVAIAVSPSSGISQGQTATFTASVTNGGSSPTYQWMVNGVPVTGATGPVFMTNTLSDQDIVACQVMSSGACSGIAGSGSITVHVMNVGVHPVAVNANDVILVPNPNNGSFTLKGSLNTAADQELTVEVTNMIGQVIYSGKITARSGVVNEKIQLINAANGMYLLNVRSETDNKVFHLVIEQ